MRKVKNENFEEFMKEHKLTKSAFCKKCGIGVKTFNNLLKGCNSNLVTVVKIANFTGFKIQDMFSWEEN